ncbi:hypothetical protein FHX37_3829 [Haloactinospora alba]|uniref:Uncharacterized protein n=1 Tax=Haloactinospora alba TaxID=405555 RepID=A0A543N9H4_9ACTN|nr:hypothetical protein [Haloactinospora alba]TQN28484.1 hypothetical protein FHX37_3829 [Haloactinospora alba]
MPAAPPSSTTTFVGTPVGHLPLVRFGLPLLGTGLGWAAKPVADWTAALPWAPMQGPFILLASFPDPHAKLACAVLGTLAGLVAAWFADRRYIRASVGDSRLTLTRGETTRTVPRSSVGAVFPDGGQVVVLGHRTEERVRIAGALDTRHLGSALLAHGYPWRADGDPHADEYRRWVPDLPGLPDGADALFRARQRALRGSDGEDAEELRAELARLGIVVRDEGRRQYWRRSQEPGRAAPPAAVLPEPGE